METLLILIPIVVAIWFACYLTQKPVIEKTYKKGLTKKEFFDEVMARSHAWWIVAAVVITILIILAMTFFPIKPIAISCAIILFALHIALAFWWNRTGSTALEMVPFLAIAIFMIPITFSVSETLGLGLGSAIALCVGVVGFCITDALRRHYRLRSAESKAEEDEDKRERIERQAKWTYATGIISGSVAVLAIVAIMLAPVISGGINTLSDITSKLPTQNDPVAEATTTDKDDFSYLPIDKKGQKKDSNFSTKVHAVDDGVIDEKEKKVIPKDLLPIMEEIIKDGKATEKEKIEVRKEVVLNNAKHNHVWLADNAFFLGLYGDPNNSEPLFDKNRGKNGGLSEKGQTLYYELKGAINASVIEMEDAPADATNTGHYNGQNIVAEAAGISGNLEAIKISAASGEVLEWILIRCGNNVIPPGKIPPKIIPPGKTDDPDPPTPTTPNKKDPAKDPVNNGNSNRGGGQNEKGDGSGEERGDSRKENPTGSSNNNGRGHSDPGTVKPTTPASPSGKSGPVHENKQDYKPDPVTNRGPVDNKKPPTKSEGDGEFTPED